MSEIVGIIDRDDAPSWPVPLILLSRADWPAWRATQPAAVQAWCAHMGFTAEPGTVCPLPGSEGAITGFVCGADLNDLWSIAALPAKLPSHASYDLAIDPQTPKQALHAALGWGLACYDYDAYRSRGGREWPLLVWPQGCDRVAAERILQAQILVRDLVNAPANACGPEELAGVVQQLANQSQARLRVIVGESLLHENYPLIYTVGCASTRPPRLIDLRWGDEDAPRVTLVGKGVCFDSGGLDIKPSSAMKLMKKDMGGAAHAIALAGMIMAAKLPVRLRLLVGAVDNAISGAAMRPLDVVKSRKGLTVEIGNTDAEGRLVLADCLAEADRDRPALLLDFATLTGAARSALGPELPALFTPDEALAAEWADASVSTQDPVARLPLWAPYRRMLDSKVADLNSCSDSPFAGAITAALFLKEFVTETPAWAHLDLYAWTPSSRPGRPEGGEAMGLRAAFALIQQRFGGSEQG